MGSLKQKSVIGIAWNLAERFGLYLIKFVIGIILARLLSPKDFGLIGMVFVFFAVAEVFIHGGFGQAYVQKKHATDLDANTIFYTNLFISVLLYVALFYGAPGIAKFYNHPELVSLTRIMGLVIIINAFNVIQHALIARAVDFKRKTKITLIGTLISGSIGIVSAYQGLGVWALVIQSLTNRLVISFGFWITTPWKPGLRFSLQSFRELFAFGSWILFSSAIRKIFDNIYLLAIGKFFPAVQVGFYSKAKQFQRLASEELAGAVGIVAFPVYSKLQEDKEKLQNAMRKFLQHSLIFIIPLIVSLIVVAQPFVILLIKEKWAPMIPYLQLLSVAGILYPIHMVNIQALTAFGKSRLSFNISLFRNLLRILNILLMYRFGVIYIIWGEVILSFIALVINIWFIEREVGYGFAKQTADIWRILMGGTIAGLIGYLPHLMTSNLWMLLISGVILTLGTFLGTQYFYNRRLLMDTIELRKNFKS